MASIVLDYAIQHPYQAAAAILLAACFATRIISGMKVHGRDVESQTKKVSVTPYWVPFVGSAISFGKKPNEYLGQLGKASNDGIVAIHMGGTTHHFVLSPSLAKSFYGKRTLSMAPLVFHFQESAMGDPGDLRKMGPSVLTGPVHKSLYNMMRDEFLTNGMGKVVEELQRLTPNLISFAQSPLDQQEWEKYGKLKIEDPDTAVIDLWSLERNYVGYIATNVLMGQNFLENNPGLLQDLWMMDSKLNNFLLKFPRFVPGMAAAYAARDRVTNAVGKWSTALNDFNEGKDTGYEWNDMSDVSDVMKLRNQAWWKSGASMKSKSSGDSSIFWAMNVNANPTIFWMLYRVISDEKLKARILHEIGPYAKLVSASGDFAVSNRPSLSLDLEALIRSCPITKATFYETMRMDSSPFSYKRVEEDTTLVESEEDAAVLGKPAPQSYFLPSGTFIAVAHGAIQTDPNFWPEPFTFNPDRFLVPDESNPSTFKADMKHLTPFGGGATMCKGRSFAEREVILFVAAMLVCWDFEPVDKEKGWAKPKKIPSSGTYTSSEYMVRMRRKLP